MTFFSWFMTGLERFLRLSRFAFYMGLRETEGSKGFTKFSRRFYRRFIANLNIHSRLKGFPYTGFIGFEWGS